MFVHRLKLRRPHVLPTWIERAELERRFDGASVLSIVAGPGYGKTVLAGQLAERWPGTALWYEFDPSDNDLAVFAAHLEAMLRAAGGETGEGAGRWQLASPKEVGSFFADALVDIPRPLVVFDDVHRLERGRSLAACAEFVERGTRAGATFVLCGRTMPFSLHAYAAAARLVTVGASDLAFDDAQVRTYLQRATPRASDAAALEVLARSAEGWPAGLALIASAPRALDVGPLSREADDDERRRYLFEYLAAEVLERVPERERRFLLETSVLEDLESDACDAVTRDTGGAQILQSLARRGVFITRRSGDTYGANQLFRAFLRHELARSYAPARIAQLHLRAAVALATRGDTPGAIAHRLDAGDVAEAAAALERAAFGMLSNGLLTRVGTFLERVGVARVDASATLLCARGRLQQLRGDWNDATLTLERAIASARERNEHDVLAEAVRVLSPILASRGEFERLSALLDTTLAQPLSEVGRTTLSLTLGAVHLECGRFEDALRSFADAMPSVVARGDLGLQGMALHNTAVAHMRRGDPQAALVVYERALHIKRTSGQRVSALMTLGNLVVLLRLLGDLDAADRMAAEMLAEALDIGNALMVAHAQENVGALALLRGRVDVAGEAFEAARRACDPGDVLFMPDIVHGLAQVALARGDLDEADRACARAISLLRSAERIQPIAPVLMTRARVAVACGASRYALDLACEAIEISKAGADAIVTVVVNLEAAALLAALPDADDRAAAAAATAVALLHERDYGFLARTKADVFATLREPFVRWKLHPGSLVPAPVLGPPLRLELLGGLRAYVEGRAVGAEAWKRRKARDILAYLVCERGRLVPRARLVDLFWPETDADAAHDNLRVTVSAIRRAVGDVVRFESSGYRFVPPLGTVVDVDVFEERVREARLARDRGEVEGARRAFRAAADGYGGDLLDGFEETPWVQRERERVRGLAVETLRWLASDDAAGAPVRLHDVDRLLDLAPLDVDAVRARLDLLSAERRLPDARRAYAEWRTRFRETIGTDAPEIWAERAF